MCQPLGMEAQMPLSWDAFVATRKTDTRRYCGCGCGARLEPRVDGERHRIGDKEVNSGCYYRELGREVDICPVGRGRLRRP